MTFSRAIRKAALRALRRPWRLSLRGVNTLSAHILAELVLYLKTAPSHKLPANRIIREAFAGDAEEVIQEL